MSRALPISPLATAGPIDDGGITYFTPGHDADTSLATKSHILLCIEFNGGKFYLIPSQDLKDQSTYNSSFMSSTTFFIALNFSHFCIQYLLFPKRNKTIYYSVLCFVMLGGSAWRLI